MQPTIVVIRQISNNRNMHSTLIYLFHLFNFFVKHKANTGLKQMALDIVRH